MNKNLTRKSLHLFLLSRRWSSQKNLCLSTALLLGTSLSCAPKPTYNDDSQLLDSGERLTVETAVASSRPLDTGESFSLGYGYDQLSAERHIQCLDKTRVKPFVTPINASYVDEKVVRNKTELAQILDIETNAEASASWGAISGSTSLKTNILKTTNLTANSVVYVLNIKYIRQKISVEIDAQPLTAEAEDLFAKDPKKFRLECGDSFTSSVNIGAAAYVVITITSNFEDNFNKTTTKEKVGVAIGSIFKTSIEKTEMKSAKETLNGFNFSVSCVTIGTSADPCLVPTVNVESENLSGLVAYVASVKMAVANSLSNRTNLLQDITDEERARRLQDSRNLDPSAGGQNQGDKVIETQNLMVGISEEWTPYRFSSGNKPFDISAQQKILKDLLEKERQVLEICELNKAPTCAEFKVALAKQIENCSQQNLWSDCNPADFDVEKLKIEAESVDKIGLVVLYERYSQTIGSGKTVTLNFDLSSESDLYLKPNTIYNLTGEYSFQDLASSFQSSLHEGWKLRLYEHPDGKGRCYFIMEGNPRTYGLTWFNDKASSFRLERENDYPLSCN